MALVKPFRVLRPDSKFVAQVAAPPYDVVSLGEARQIAEGNPNCFLRIGRAELELADGTNPYSDEVYAHGAANLQRLIKEGWLIQESKPSRLEKDPVSALAVSVLTERVLDPLLGIKDQRSDPRIDFVGGSALQRN